MTTMMRRSTRAPRCLAWRKGLALGAMLAVLAGCTILPDVKAPVDLYTLTPKTSYTEHLPKANYQLVVEQPNAAAGLDTTRIALSRTPYTLEYYARAAWTDNAPAMVQNLMIESFESTKAIVAVGREAISLIPDYILQTDLREFEAVYDGGDPVPTVWVRLNAKLVQMPERRIIASRTVEHKVKAASGRFPDVIGAWDDALGKAIKEIVIFTLKSAKPVSS